jgi:predicted nucleic acid-binding protein
MTGVILDTNILCEWWRRDRPRDAAQARERALKLMACYLPESCSILTPIRLEVLCGTRDRSEQRITEAYLAEFRCADEGKVLIEDWIEAERIAKRILFKSTPRKRKTPPEPVPRDFCDCLIRAIANRLRMDVVTRDESFPSR